MGTNDLTRSPYHSRNIRITDIIIPPDFIMETFVNDIALFRLKRAVRYNDYIQPICLPFGVFQKLDQNTACFISGWGRTREEGNYCLSPTDMPSCLLVEGGKPFTYKCPCVHRATNWLVDCWRIRSRAVHTLGEQSTDRFYSLPVCFILFLYFYLFIDPRAKQMILINQLFCYDKEHFYFVFSSFWREKFPCASTSRNPGYTHLTIWCPYRSQPPWEKSHLSQEGFCLLSFSSIALCRVRQDDCLWFLPPTQALTVDPYTWQGE
jgi:hypothetical protein